MFKPEHFDSVRFGGGNYPNMIRIEIANTANKIVEGWLESADFIQICGLTLPQIQECRNFYVQEKGKLPDKGEKR